MLHDCTLVFEMKVENGWGCGEATQLAADLVNLELNAHGANIPFPQVLCLLKVYIHKVASHIYGS